MIFYLISLTCFLTNSSEPTANKPDGCFPVLRARTVNKNTLSLYICWKDVKLYEETFPTSDISAILNIFLTASASIPASILRKK